MSLLDGLRHRVYVLLGGEAYAREVERELRFHTELDALGADAELSPRRFGNVTYYREEVRRMSMLDWVDVVRQDATYAWRGLRRTPAFTATVVVTLGLGLGVNAAMYSFLHRVFLAAPPGVERAHEVRRVYNFDPTRRGSDGGRFITATFPYPAYEKMREVIGDARAIVALTEPESVAVIDGERTFTSRRSFVGAQYFALLGVRAQLGRFFAADEDRMDRPSMVAVISDALWRTAFGADPRAVGKTVMVGKSPFTVVGVAAPDFSGVSLNRADLWIPLSSFPGRFREGRPWYMGRGNFFRILLRAPDAAADQRLRSIAAAGFRSGMEQAYGRRDSASTLLTGPLAESRAPTSRAQELTVSTRLAGVALVVLVIACANVANLLIVRALRRHREISLRRALGMSRPRLFGQLLTESVSLAAISGAVAIAFAFWAADALRRTLLPAVQWASGAVDDSVVLFVGASALVVGVVAGLAPAVHAIKPDVADALRAGSRDSAYRRSWLRGTLLAGQAALSVVLLVGAALFARSLSNVEAIDIGYEATRIIHARPFYDQPDRNDGADVKAAVASAARALEAHPQIEEVTVARVAPMTLPNGFRIFLPGRPLPKQYEILEYPHGQPIAENYFTTVGLRLTRGRGFARGDDGFVAEGAPRTIVVSAALARAFWPGADALGKCVIFSEATNPCTTVIGVVEDARQLGIIEEPPLWYYYPAGDVAGTTLIARTRSTASPRMKEEIRRVLAAELPGKPFVQVTRMSEQLEPHLRPWRLGAKLFGSMSLLAVLVAAIGIYSVVAYGASQRTQEMGIRLALGARARDILDLVAADGLRPVGVGVALGVAASLAMGRLVASLLFGVTANDASALLLAASLVALVGVVASLIPGARAARADPAKALRAE